MEANIRNVHVERYYPSVLSNAKEFQAIAAAENPELEKIWLALWKWMLNTFVTDIDEAGASRWEAMLKIRPLVSDTLEARRTVILAKINTVLPYTYRRLQQILDTLCGAGTYEILLDHVKCEFGLRTLPGAKGIEKIIGILRPILPANLSMFMQIVRQAQLNYTVGVLNCQIGRKTINLPTIPISTISANAGIAHLQAGRKTIGLPIPVQFYENVYAGMIIHRTGRITIGGIR